MIDFEAFKSLVLDYHGDGELEDYYVGNTKNQYQLDATDELEKVLAEIFKREVHREPIYNAYQSIEICYKPLSKNFKSRFSVYANTLRKKGDFYYLEIKISPFLADIPCLEALWRRFFVSPDDPEQPEFERYEWDDPYIIQTLNIEPEIQRLREYFQQQGYIVIPSSFLDQEWKGMPRQLLDEYFSDPATYRDFLMPGFNPDN